MSWLIALLARRMGRTRETIDVLHPVCTICGLVLYQCASSGCYTFMTCAIDRVLLVHIVDTSPYVTLINFAALNGTIRAGIMCRACARSPEEPKSALRQLRDIINIIKIVTGMLRLMHSTVQLYYA